MDANEEAKSLVNEIFQLTGQKVEVNDPIVAAALIHSQLIRRAGQDATGAIQSSVAQGIKDLAEAAKALRVAQAAAPKVWKVRVAVSLSLVVLVSAAAGAVLGGWYIKRSPSEQEARELAAGRDFLQVLPQLDAATREKIAKLVAKNRQ